MIVDNADELNLFYNSANNSTSLLLSKYLPFNTRGGILFTTRDHRAATKYAAKQVIGIEEMDDEESRELFSRSLQNKQLLKDNTGVIKLLELLVNLPLAIVQAAAYLNENTTTIAQYLQIYEESSDGFIQLLSEDFEDEGRYPEIKNPIIATWLISFNQIRGRDSLAADYLAFISCIKEENIPLILLPEAPLFDKTKALGTLKGFKFVNEQSGGVLISMHRLVHLAMRNWLKAEGEWALWSGNTLDRMEAVFPRPEYENRTFWTALLPHAQYIIASTKDFNVQDRPRLNLLRKLGRCFGMTGNDKNSQEMYQQELELNEEVLGKENPLTLTSMSNLALALRNQGKYNEAEPIHRQALALKKKVLGEEHPVTLCSINNLASLLTNQGKYNEAEPMHYQILALCEKVLGKEHPNTLNSMNNLAVLLKNQGKYDEAEPIYRQTLALREKVLGKEHQDTLISMSNLALLLKNQGKYNEAEKLCKS
jgi:tetratricopeptide (TPR) repeat protein